VNGLSRRRIIKYLADNPRIRAQITFEIDHPYDSQEGQWLYYDDWSQKWRDRVLTLCILFSEGKPLPLADPLPIIGSNIIADASCLGYCSQNAARDAYFAQIAHVLYLELSGKVPWRLNDWSNYELSYLLSSKVCFTARRFFSNPELYYVVYACSRSDATENILGDPRVPYHFMKCEPEQKKCLIGKTPSETGQYLSGWFHDYLIHNSANFNYQDFHRNNPLLKDRLKRHAIGTFGNMYLTVGCWGASALFADLLRSVNIPIRKTKNIICQYNETEETHSGLEFNWQSNSANGRYLMHTDNLYYGSYFKDPAPSPKGTDRGVALWDYVWLDPTVFGQVFSYQKDLDIFGKATWEQYVKYNEMHDWLVSSAQAIQIARSLGKDGTINFLQRERGFSEVEANACWQPVEASVLSYGNGNLEQGYKRLLDGPRSRHSQWCRRTQKC
jgi:hypothetical protein